LPFMIVHGTFDLLLYRDRRVKLLLQKLRKATMCRGSLRSARRDAHLTPILKNNLAVEGCWPAFLLALGSVDVLTGKKNVRYLQISYVYTPALAFIVLQLRVSKLIANKSVC
jgi:hypothetical protein